MKNLKAIATRSASSERSSFLQNPNPRFLLNVPALGDSASNVPQTPESAEAGARSGRRTHRDQTRPACLEHGRRLSPLLRMLAGCLFLFAAMHGSAAQQDLLKALIVDGQNNHPWQQTTPMLKAILETSGMFEVSVATSPPKGQPVDGFFPDFAGADVVVLNYNGALWPEPTRIAFVDFVQQGGGVVVVHAANNSFPQWEEYNQIIGLGGWGGRNEESGPLVRYRNGKVVYDNSPGRAGRHPPQFEYRVVSRDSDHPITSGLPPTWMHAADELYSCLRGPAENLNVLATSFCDPERKNGTGEHEPALFTVTYGDGRVFHTILGHAAPQMQCVGFIVTLRRGTEWAATGKVSQSRMPEDFPGPDEPSVRSLEQLGVTDLPSPQRNRPYRRRKDPFKELVSFEFGTTRAATRAVKAAIRRASQEELREIEGKLLSVLRTPAATAAGKQFVCRMLRRIGSANSVPALALLLNDPVLSHAARFALQGMPVPEAGSALRTALGQVEGELKIGVVDSIGERGDSRAVAALVEMATPGKDSALRRAAVISLAKIGGREAARALADVVFPPDLKAVAARAGLRCADRLHADGENEQAVALYQKFVSECTGTVRFAALRGLIRIDEPAAVPVLLDMLRDDAREQRLKAGALLSEIKDSANIRYFAENIAAFSPDIALFVIEMIGRSADDAFIPTVLKAADSEDEVLRTAAYRAMGRLGNVEHVSVLLNAAAGEGAPADAARESLYHLSDKRIEPALLAIAENRQNTDLRIEAVKALGARAQTEKCLPGLIRLAGDPDDQLRQIVFRTLGALAGKNEVPEMVGMLLAHQTPDSDRSLIAASLVSVARRIDDPDAVAVPLIAMLTNADPPAISEAMTVLKQIGGEKALAVIRELLTHEDPEIKKRAITILGEWENSAPAPDLLAILKTSDDLQQRVLAFRGYLKLISKPGYMSAQNLAGTLAGALDLAPRTEEKKLVLAEFAKLSTPEAMQYVRPLLEDPQLANEAASALSSISESIGGIVVLDREAVLHAEGAEIHGDGAKYESKKNRKCIGRWDDIDTWVSWTMEVLAPGIYEVGVSQSLKPATGAEYKLEVGDQELVGAIVTTKDWADFQEIGLGRVRFDTPGVKTVAVRPLKMPPGTKHVGNLRSIRLRMVEQ